jgi:uncharacterized protein involved in outer membrane biogenesis
VQSTLLGIAIVVIVALVTALVGPLFIDWGRYRPTFEAEASRFLGTPVRITGAIDARILPSLTLSLRGIELGPSGPSSRTRAQSLDVEFALGPLVRGQWSAAALHLRRPELSLGLDRTGRLESLPFTLGLGPDQVSIDRLVVDDGIITIRDAASGTRMVLDQLWFHGDMRSLAGPVKGEGAFVTSGQLYGYSLNAARRGEDGGTKLRLSLDPADRPLAIETEGTLWVDAGAPRYEGTATLVRPVGLVLADGKKLVSEPWRLASHIKANATSALLEQLEFQYGPEERGIKLTGTADMQFGLHPRFEGVLSARQVDLDRSFARADDTNRLPLATLRSFAAGLGDAIRPSILVKLGIGIDTLTLGGAALQSVRGDIESDAEAWNLQTFEFRAPGATQVKLSGRLKVTPNATEFVGPAVIDSSDPSALVAWIEGLSEPPKMAMGSMRVRGDVTLGSERIAVERLSADADRKAFEGRFSYLFAAGSKPARLDAALSAPDVDVDAAIALGKAAFAGSKLDKPGEIALAIDVGRATFGGVEAKRAAANIEFDAGGLRIERLSISDLAGAALNASGRIDASSAPRGALSLVLDAQKLDGVAALAAKFAPGIAERIQAFAQHAAPAKLSATLNVEPLAGEQSKSATKLIVDGKLGAAHASFIGDATGELAAPAAADMRVEGLLESDDGGALIALLGLDHTLTVDRRAGRLTLSASGTAGADIRVDGKITAGGLDAAVAGTVRWPQQDPKANLDLSASAADVTPLRREDLAPAPVSVKTKIALAGDTLTFRDFTVNLAGSAVRGQISLALGQPIRLDGRIAAETIDVPTVITSAIGMPAPSGARTNAQWSIEPFASSPLAGFEGKIPFYAVRATIAPGTVAQQVRGVVRFEPSGIALEESEGNLADGHLLVQANVRRDESGLSAHGKISLTNADLAVLGGAPSRAAGRMSVQVEADAAGLSPATLVGALTGSGTMSVEAAQFNGLDPAAIETAIASVDRGLPVDSPKISDVVTGALEAGKLNVPSATGTITISSGRARLASLAVPAQGADVSVNTVLDFVEQTLDGRVTLSGAPKSNAPGSLRPQLSVDFKGPIIAPRRSVDLSAFIGWLTLRSVERETKRLEAIQSKEPIKDQNKDPGNVGSTPARSGQSKTLPDLPPAIIIKPPAAPKGPRPPARALAAPEP